MKPVVHTLILLFIFFSITLQAANFHTAESNLLIMVDEHSVCKNVKNLDGRSLFVPTKTSAEWSSFRTNTPTNVNLTDCCPTGFIPVPGDSNQGTEDFCVMQYEAKNVSGVPTSQAASAPWNFIDYHDAVNECRSLGAGFNLITNAEFQTIAQNLEFVDSNWSGGARGLGCLKIGNNGFDSSCSYNNGGVADFGTSRPASAVSNLSNGSQIYDIGGNVTEFIRSGYTFSPASGFVGAFDPGWSDKITGVERELFGPKADDYTLGCVGDDSDMGQCGLGFMYIDGGNYYVRGGYYADVGSDTFYMHQDHGANEARTGFRCTYHPTYSSWLSYSNPSPPTNGGFESGSFTGWTQTASDDGNWNVVSDVKYAGTYSARSKNSQGDSQISCIERVVDLTSASNDHRVQWMWKVSSEADYDFGIFYINDVIRYTISGEYDWYLEDVRLEVGSSYTLKWCYEKDAGALGGSDYLWVDNFDVIELN